MMWMEDAVASLKVNIPKLPCRDRGKTTENMSKFPATVSEQILWAYLQYKISLFLSLSLIRFYRYIEHSGLLPPPFPRHTNTRVTVKHDLSGIPY